MIKTITLQPGITLRCCTDTRFKTNCLSLQLVRPMCRSEVSANALISAVLLRGTEQYPDLRDITLRLDDLYGATVGSLVRRVGDYQTTGFYCSFTEDRYALGGDKILEPVVDFLGQLLLRPKLENGVFDSGYVEGEKRNMLSAMEAQKNDKRIYAAAQLMKYMCANDSTGIPRLGEPEQVDRLEASGLYAHYRNILRESCIELFYVGSQEPEKVAQLLSRVFRDTERSYVNLPPQTPFQDGGKTRREETMDVTQGKLQMGFVTHSTLNTPDFVPMQVLNSVFGGGMTSKLFMNVREKMSLCYDISSSYQGSKGILTVGAGMDSHMAQTVEDEILCQLEQCRMGNITDQELVSARQSLLSSLRSIPDSPGSIENFYATGALSGLNLGIREYMEQVQQVTVPRLAELAGCVQPHSVFLLKGVQ